jgi:DASH complex subunit SPC19
MSMQNPTSTYGDCVASLRTSLSFLESSVTTLGAGVQDFPRLSSVLKTVRVRRDSLRLSSSSTNGPNSTTN